MLDEANAAAAADSDDYFAQVTLHAVRKVFGRFPALAGVDAELSAGQLTVLMGPNGAGKSTLLGIISTLGRPTSGEIRYGDADFREAQAFLRHRIGLVSHAALLYRELSPRENLLFFAKLYGLGAAGERRVADLIEQMALADFIDRPLRQLSRGMTQRVSLARALLPDPHLLLFDEPFTGLDYEAIALLRRHLGAARAGGKIVLVVTHDIDSIDGLTDHLLVLRSGRIVRDMRAETGSGRLSASLLREHYREALR